MSIRRFRHFGNLKMPEYPDGEFVPYTDHAAEVERLTAERDAAVARAERAEEALQFYADRKSYDGHYMMSPLVTQDQGKRARAALSPEPWGGSEE